mmetsp:Transcript_90541/g.255595  ORF Transcript_90541/g.255595 Transcript_90541/m.255595 type:complete len:529 (+) Transcript_90541:111-1697(+)
MHTLDAVLREVASKRAKLKDTEGAGVDYAEVWATFIRYLKSCLEQKRGLHLPGFCKVGWQVQKQNVGGTAVYKPCFQVTEQFCRTYCNQEALRKLGATGGAELCPFEDFNFSKAAIKFSQNMQKDQVFSGLRIMTQQIGEWINEGKELDIEFGDVGRFFCKEREPRFAFSPEVYHQEGLEVPTSSMSMDEGPRSGAAFRKSAPSTAMGLGVRGSGAGAASRPPATPMPPPIQEEEYPQSEYGADDFGPTMMRGGPPGDASPPQRSLTPSSSAPSLNIGTPGSRTHILTGQQFKREIAFKEAMDRHIGEMEARASEAMQEKQAWSRHVGECLQQERDDIVSRRMRNQENQYFVQQQKLLNEEKRKECRQEDIISASAHDFPKFTEPAESEMKEFVQGQQARMRADLDEQVRTNSTLRNLAKQRERALEINQLEANRAEMRMLRDAERAKKAYDREALATAWNSEIRMKNIWKAIDSHSKVGSHSPQVMVTDGVPPSRGGSSMRSAGRMMTGSSRRVPLGSSRSLSQLQR